MFEFQVAIAVQSELIATFRRFVTWFMIGFAMMCLLRYSKKHSFILNIIIKNKIFTLLLYLFPFVRCSPTSADLPSPPSVSTGSLSVTLYV